MDPLFPLLSLAGLYLLPALLALLVRHRERWIIATITVVLGWTVLGWLLAWSLLLLPMTWQGQVLRLRQDLAHHRLGRDRPHGAR